MQILGIFIQYYNLSEEKWIGNKEKDLIIILQKGITSNIKIQNSELEISPYFQKVEWPPKEGAHQSPTLLPPSRRFKKEWNFPAANKPASSYPFNRGINPNILPTPFMEVYNPNIQIIGNIQFTFIHLPDMPG